MGANASHAQVSLADVNQFSDDQIENMIAVNQLSLVHKMAYKQAELRERLNWEIMAGGTMTALLLLAGSIYKRRDMVIPMVPIVMTVGYRYDQAYGTAPEVIRDSAESLLMEKTRVNALTGKPITLRAVDDLCAKWRTLEAQSR